MNLRVLVKFAEWVLGEIADGSDLDGGSVQDKALELGILHKVEATEPCGESCGCAEFVEFPTDCNRWSPAFERMTEDASLGCPIMAVVPPGWILDALTFRPMAGNFVVDLVWGETAGTDQAKRIHGYGKTPSLALEAVAVLAERSKP